MRHYTLFSFRVATCFAHFCSVFLCYAEAARPPVPVNSSGDKMSLEQAMNDLCQSVAQAREVLAKSTSTLEAVHKQVLPHDPLPGDTEGFLGVLGPGSSMMASFARALTVRGSESTFKMILAHRIPGDFASGNLMNMPTSLVKTKLKSITTSLNCSPSL